MALNAQARAVVALMKAGVDAAAVERLAGTLDVDDVDDMAAIDAKVAALKAEIPAVFAPGPSSLVGLAGGSGAPKPQPESMAATAERLHSEGVIGDDALARARVQFAGKTPAEVGAQIARDRYPQPPNAA
ncbi:MAG: hypothetical protein JWN46_83 [Acidimicrobiales bacterium]|nr:hypothetical protein [Acidimicrobiales bacterium]